MRDANKRARRRDALATYRAKRNFGKTAEPPGSLAKRKVSSLGYLIQKHAARRLHYDFRLEMDGTLKSWAVTRGPSLDPADKRLAVHVEDHPLDYGSFEGTIPKGEYGGGTVMLWDRGTWEPVGDMHKGYKTGRLTFILHGERLKGEWHLVRMKSRASKERHENWLLIKSNDKYADTKNGDSAIEKHQTSVVTKRPMESIAVGSKAKSAKSPTSQKKSPEKAGKTKVSVTAKSVSPDQPLPQFVAPQLATLVAEPPSGEGWVHEIKFDGYRALCRVEGDDVRLITRANHDWTQKFSGIAREIEKLPFTNALLDGEIVCVGEDGRMSFHALQNALKHGKQDRLHYYVFDLLHLGGYDLRGQTLLERKKLLRKLIPLDHKRIHYSEHFNRPGTDVFQHACRIALEGIISKRADAHYESGRSHFWLKEKCTNEQEFVIGGFTAQPNHPDRLAALLIGYYRKNDLIYAGKVGTGFNRDEAETLLEKFKTHRAAKSPFIELTAEARRHAVWVEPRLVAQIHFTEWTEDGRLRHPSYQGLREDKPASEVVREKHKKPPFQADISKPVAASKSRALPSTIKSPGLKLSHPEKILWPEDGMTKSDLADYYQSIMRWVLPHVANRPISLMRCPGGAGKHCFFQRHAGEGLSPHILTVEDKSSPDAPPYIMIRDEGGLMALVQMDVMEIHAWNARADNIESPDRIIFDLDPHENVPWPKIRAAALEVRQRLKDHGLESVLKLTGGKGLHIMAPITRKYDWKAVKEFTRAMALQMVKDSPKLYTANMRKTERVGKIFIDYLRNDRTASAIAPYSTRARPGAPVAMPVRWDELPNLKNAHAFDIRDAPDHIRACKKDPWQEIKNIKQSFQVV